MKAIVVPNRRFVLAGLAAATALPRSEPLYAQSTLAEAAESSGGRFKRPRNDRPFAEGRVARGSRTIAAAWFSDATPRYRHFALGGELEPPSIVISTADQRTFKLTLPEDSVFEDREPRIVDIDGTDMVIAVRSYLKKGAAMALIGLAGSELKIVAETPPIGQPFRWLNPIGPADFAGDGILQIALVRTPHVDGQLQLWTARNGQLVQSFELDDVCNHALRSPFMRLHAIADFNGDGVADLAIPSGDRRRIRFLTFRNGRIREFGTAELPSVAAEDFKIVMTEGRRAVQVGLSSGRKVLVAP